MQNSSSIAASASLKTPWTDQVSQESPLNEYPRPQLVRSEWQSLNGPWSYAIRPREDVQPSTWDGEILVPFAAEAALSGVEKRVGTENRLWYSKSFTVPTEWQDQDVMLHFGAVDWHAEVWLNGTRLGEHRGGYDGFSFGLENALRSSGELQELVVAVWDPTDDGTQPRGKQVAEPKTIWYTSVTGIWQTVWIEPVPRSRIQNVVTVPVLESDQGAYLAIDVESNAPSGAKVTARSMAPGRVQVVVSGSVEDDGRVSMKLAVPEPILWTPDQPFLYDLKISLEGQFSGGAAIENSSVQDVVTSYFGMREIALGSNRDGPPQLLLNGEPLFQFGPLDQGWWPDGLYTAPTDQALIHDIEVTKALGFNMLRKHVKVEPARFYYHCDRLGLMVWQDMPNGDRHIRPDQPDIERTEDSARQFEAEWRAVIEGLRNHPSIVMWVPFNEGWGQFDTARISDFTRSVDSTRLVNATSGWADRGVGDVMDIHSYPGPKQPEWEDVRAGALGEFGGLGLPLPGHLWKEDGNWGYRAYPTRVELREAYQDLIEQLRPMIRDGLAAAVYTQTSDVEIEVNGFMTYDRRVNKLDPSVIGPLNRSVFDVGPAGGVRVTQESFGVIEKDGVATEASLFTLQSDAMSVRLTDFGGTLVGIHVPDRNGAVADVLLGYDSVEGYGLRETPYFGSIVGRYANRIAKGRFKLDGKKYRLPINNGENSLHGGLDGVSRVFWKAQTIETKNGVGVELRYRSVDGEEGYPGNVDMTVRYLLTQDQELRIETEATTDQPTVVNLSFHSYFNLAGQGRGDILGHEMQILASKYTPVDQGLIPTGELPDVEGSPMDFRQPTLIGERIDADFEQLEFGSGYDHNWVLDDQGNRTSTRRSSGEPPGRRLQRVAVVREPGSGRRLEVLSTQPGLQFYSGNFLDGSIHGKGGVAYPRRSGFALETQHFPDSPNQPDFPNTVLRPGETYRQVTVYRFGTTP